MLLLLLLLLCIVVSSFTTVVLVLLTATCCTGCRVEETDDAVGLHVNCTEKVESHEAESSSVKTSKIV